MNYKTVSSILKGLIDKNHKKNHLNDLSMQLDFPKIMQSTQILLVIACLLLAVIAKTNSAF